MRNWRSDSRPRAFAALVLLALAVPFTPAARAQVKLEYKYPEGQKLTYKTTSKTSQVLTLMGQPIETESKETVVASSTAGKKRPDGTLPIEQKVEAIAVELSLPMGIQVSYDSKDPNAKIDNPQLAFLGEIYKLAGESSYTVVIDGKNKVKAIEGAEKLLEKADKLENPIAKMAIRGRADAEKLRRQYEQSHGNLPDVLARQGEPWERTEKVEIGGGQTLTFQKKYEYAGTEKRGDATLDKINVKTTDVKYEMDPNTPTPLKATKSDLKVDSGDGTILFDRDGGKIVSTKGKIHIKGTMDFEAGGQQIPGELDLTIESSTELQPAAK
jgi:hypothetical protein